MTTLRLRQPNRIEKVKMYMDERDGIMTHTNNPNGVCSDKDHNPQGSVPDAHDHQKVMTYTIEPIYVRDMEREIIKSVEKEYYLKARSQLDTLIAYINGDS